jgi:hypothetical protein
MEVEQRRALRASGLSRWTVLLLVIGTTGGFELDGDRIGLLGMPFRGVPALVAVSACLYLGIYLRGLRRSAGARRVLCCPQ